MKYISLFISLILVVQSFADSAPVDNEITGFWLGSNFAVQSNSVVKRGTPGVFEGSDFSSSITELVVTKNDSHWDVSGVAKTHIRGGRTYIFLGSDVLLHGQIVVPVAMPDMENKFSFRVQGSLVAQLSKKGALTSTGEHSFPRFLYIATPGQPVKRISLEQLENSEKANKAEMATPRKPSD